MQDLTCIPVKFYLVGFNQSFLPAETTLDPDAAIPAYWPSFPVWCYLHS
jgi:hypothetical protein